MDTKSWMKCFKIFRCINEKEVIKKKILKNQINEKV